MGLYKQLGFVLISIFLSSKVFAGIPPTTYKDAGTVDCVGCFTVDFQDGFDVLKNGNTLEVDATAAGGGDNITVNTTAATNANFLDNIYFDWAIDTVATPDDITAKPNYNAASGDLALLASEVAFSVDGLISEGLTADTIEGRFAFPDWGTSDKVITFQDATHTVVGRDTTDTLTNKTIDSASNTFSNITAAETLLTAGRSLTLSTNDVLADVELYTNTFCYRLPASPVATDDDKSIWINDTANGFTVTKLWCESDQTVTMMLQVDDGTPADMDTVDLVCISTPDTDTSLDGDATIAAGDRVDLDVASVASTPTWAVICFTGVWDD